MNWCFLRVWETKILAFLFTYHDRQTHLRMELDQMRSEAHMRPI